jgi:excinuclease ABC subunit C
MKKAERSPLLVEKLKSVPNKPGCYIFKDDKGTILYVGKAVSLRSRVRSYFQASAKHGLRIARLVSKTEDMEWILVDSEVEALVLECNLIKKHRPPYNVRLRDDKSYPYVVITNEPFPRVMFTRKLRKDGGRYFGPFTSAWAVRDTLRTLHKIYPLIPCGKSWDNKPRQRPCLYYHLGQCLGPCAGLSDKNQYDEIISQVSDFLGGKHDARIAEMRAKINEYAEKLEFEKAAELRDRLQAMEAVLEKQKVLMADGVDRDVVAVVKDDRGSMIQMLYVRGGKLIGQHQFLLDGAKEANTQEAVQEFVKQHYSDAPELPKEILLPVEIEERRIVEQWLQGRKGSAVKIVVPQRGEKLRLVEMAAENAEAALNAYAQEMEVKEGIAEAALTQLAEALELPAPPARIECYDISNIQGTAPVGSMVVALQGEPAKAEYRKFRIKFQPETPNDFAMMNEVIMRRLRANLDGRKQFQALPDLVVIDGGKGQLSAAIKARDELGFHGVPFVGLAKRFELLILPEYGEDGSLNGYREVQLPLQSPALTVVRRLRDEAHRFAISYHRKVRDKRVGGSVLEEIPGLGPRRQRMLLRTFGSIEAIREATVEQIAAVPTMTATLASRVSRFLNED